MSGNRKHDIGVESESDSSDDFGRRGDMRPKERQRTEEDDEQQRKIDREELNRRIGSIVSPSPSLPSDAAPTNGDIGRDRGRELTVRDSRNSGRNLQMDRELFTTRAIPSFPKADDKATASTSRRYSKYNYYTGRNITVTGSYRGRKVKKSNSSKQP